MTRSTPPSDHVDRILREQARRLFGRLVRGRLLASPVFALSFLTLALVDPAPWRRAWLTLAAALVVGVSIWEGRRALSEPRAPVPVLPSVALGTAMQLSVVATTGGLESPLLPVLLLLCVVTAVASGRSWLLLGVVSAQLVAVWIMAAVAILGRVPGFYPALLGGGTRGGLGDAHLVTGAVVLSGLLPAAALLGVLLRRTVLATWRLVEDAQRDALRAHAERADELRALSGEIAHELKNPLASVKGLAALLARDAGPDSKPAERLGVLRREVDRMQEILDEFLNFSRPLVPLSHESVELGALADEVAALHEGLARERGVALEVARGSRVPVRCDPRKVKQVVINVLQNALDASPPGGTVRIEVRGGPGGEGRLAVTDHGPGLADPVAGRVFEAGITTKERGSGLGLTIARALARQHGGELTLGGGPDGGCIAELTLPREPSAEAPPLEASDVA